MRTQLTTLGMNEKEILVYSYLAEYGISPASEVAKHINIPKSSVNFIADSLWKSGFLKKSFKGNTGYYEADIETLKNTIKVELEKKDQALSSLIPLLEEKTAHHSSRPSIYFFEGIDSCKNAYLEILGVEDKQFYEFGAHTDLESAFGKKFMDNFINSRIEKGVLCHAIGTNNSTMESLQLEQKKQLRDLKIFTPNFGNISSSICIYEGKVLILNLKDTHIGVLIENFDFADTMKTIFRLSRA